MAQDGVIVEYVPNPEPRNWAVANVPDGRQMEDDGSARPDLDDAKLDVANINLGVVHPLIASARRRYSLSSWLRVEKRVQPNRRSFGVWQPQTTFAISMASGRPAFKRSLNGKPPDRRQNGLA
jgi:hypothetical protein